MDAQQLPSLILPAATLCKQPPKKRRQKIGPAQVKRQNDRLAAYIAAKEATRLAHEASGYNPLNPGYNSATTSSTPPAGITPGLVTYQPTPRDVLAKPATPTPAAKTTPPHHPRPSTAKSSPDFPLDELFERMAKYHTASIEATTGKETLESSRTLDELLRSPVWELELSCSPIRLTPERATRHAQDTAKGDTIPRQLFCPQDEGEKPSPERRPLTSDNRARTAPRRGIKLIPPPADDPSTIRRATRPQRPPTKPRGPTTRYLGSPGKPRPAPRPRAYHHVHPYRV